MEAGRVPLWRVIVHDSDHASTLAYRPHIFYKVLDNATVIICTYA